MRKLMMLPALLLALLIPASPALAMDEPDSVNLYGIAIFQDLINTDDFLAIVPYHIPFTVQPGDNIDKTFTFRIMSADGTTEMGAITAAPKYDGGYGYGIVSFYIESGTTWGESYIFRVQENPVYYPDPQHWDFTIGSSAYSSGSDQEAELRSKVIDTADDLSAAFGVELLSTGDSGMTVLSTYGELYYIAAVPGLQIMCPTLFSVQIETPSYTKRSWSYTLADSLRTKYAGTFIADFMTGYAGLFSMDTNAAMNVLSIILFAAVIFLSVWKFKASMLSAFVDGYAFLLLLMLVGWWSMVLNGLFAFLSVAVGGIILFLNKS